jgi:hypothetical protein
MVRKDEISAETLQRIIKEERERGAREVLTYLYSECEEWKSDTDGEYIDGIAVGTTTHSVRFDDSLLTEIVEMAGLSTWGVYAVDTLKDASRRDEEEHARQVEGAGKAGL